MPAELARVEQWMYSTLAGDATVSSIVSTRIYADEAPQEAAFPMIIFAHIGNVDILRSGSNGRFAKNIYLVRAIGRGSSVQGDILTVADRFDPLLLVSNVTVNSVRIAYVQHDQHAIRKDSSDGIPVAYIGSYYLVFTQPV
jgi:hypothetical protein